MRRLATPQCGGGVPGCARRGTRASQAPAIRPRHPQHPTPAACSLLQVVEPLVEQRGESAAATVIAALIFGAGVWGFMGPEKGAEYFAGYLLEQSLSGEAAPACPPGCSRGCAAARSCCQPVPAAVCRAPAKCGPASGHRLVAFAGP